MEPQTEEQILEQLYQLHRYRMFVRKHSRTVKQKKLLREKLGVLQNQEDFLNKLLLSLRVSVFIFLISRNSATYRMCRLSTYIDHYL